MELRDPDDLGQQFVLGICHEQNGRLAPVSKEHRLEDERVRVAVDERVVVLARCERRMDEELDALDLLRPARDELTGVGDEVAPRVQRKALGIQPRRI